MSWSFVTFFFFQSATYLLGWLPKAFALRSQLGETNETTTQRAPFDSWYFKQYDSTICAISSNVIPSLLLWHLKQFLAVLKIHFKGEPNYGLRQY